MIRAGGKYKTNNGKVFECEKDLSDTECYFPYYFGGWIKNQDGTPDRWAFYVSNGQYMHYKKSEYDLVDIN